VGLTVATATVTLTATTYNGTFAGQVGDTGPGGGKIFYVAATPFSCGPTRAAQCTYLEAAPTSDNAAWSGNTSPTPIGTTGTAIGTGYANTLAIVGQSNGGATENKAGTITRAYRGPNNLSDWFLPSKDELNQMCKWARGITGVDLTTVTTACAGGTINTGLGAAGFEERSHFSSTEVVYQGAASVQIQSFTLGSFYTSEKQDERSFRAVRAF
jgi:hypothetical protein